MSKDDIIITLFTVRETVKMKLYFSLIILFIPLLVPNSVSAQFPLKVGNEWNYVDGWWSASGEREQDTVTYRIVSDTTMSNGKTYYKMFPNRLRKFGEFLRADSNGIYFYDTVCQSEILRFNYHLEEGKIDSIAYSTCSDDGAYSVEFVTNTEYIFGSQIQTMTFHFVYMVDAWNSVSLSPEFGFTSFSSASFSQNYYTSLIGCKISNVNYGYVTSVEDKDFEPSAIQLLQNYPNPFNPTTEIEFYIPNQSKVGLKIYDILGEVINTLIDTELSKGWHRIVFDATNLPSGVYLYRLETNRNFLTNKMLLLK